MTSGTTTWSCHGLARPAFHHQVAAELAGEHDERAVQQAALLQVEHKLRDRRVDRLFQGDQAGVAVLVRVPILEGNILRRDFDEPRARLGQPPREQAAQPEPAGVVLVVRRLRLQGQVEGLCRRRAQQAMRVVQRAEERLLLEIAAVFSHGTFPRPVCGKSDRGFRSGPGSCPRAGGRSRPPAPGWR